jgi:hypothetical protein
MLNEWNKIYNKENVKTHDNKLKIQHLIQLKKKKIFLKIMYY